LVTAAAASAAARTECVNNEHICSTPVCVAKLLILHATGSKRLQHPLSTSRQHFDCGMTVAFFFLLLTFRKRFDSGSQSFPRLLQFLV
jgi:hypothetical protein